MIYSLLGSVLSIKNYLGGGGGGRGAPCTTSISYSAKVCIFANIFNCLCSVIEGYTRITLLTWVDALQPVCMRGSFLLLSRLHLRVYNV